MSKKICVGIDARMLYSSGIGVVIRNFIIRLVRRRPEWNFVLLGDADEIEKIPECVADNVEIVMCRAPIYSIREQLELPIKIPRRVNVFWSPHYNVPLFWRGTLIVTIHDLAHLALKDMYGGIVRSLYAKIMYNMACKKARKIICVSKFTIKELQKFLSHKYDRKIELIYNGVDKRWSEYKNFIKYQGNPYFIYVGNVKPHKNLSRLIKAYLNIHEHIPQNLKIVGRKSGFITGDNSIDKYIRGYDDIIEFTGWVTDDELMYLIKNADALVFPSLYEGFGLPPLEALACGCNVLASNIASITEICMNHVTYFNPLSIDDMAKKMLLFKKEPIDLKFAETFSWDIAVERMEELIINITG